MIERFYEMYKLTASQIGVRLDKSGNRAKCQSPTQTVIALGVNFDTETWRWSADYEKATFLLEKIRDTLTNGMPDLKERQRMVGKIQQMSQ